MRIRSRHHKTPCARTGSAHCATRPATQLNSLNISDGMGREQSPILSLGPHSFFRFTRSACSDDGTSSALRLPLYDHHAFAVTGFLRPGDDLPSYSRHNGWFLIAGAIDKCVYITIHPRFVEGFLLKYSHMEEVGRSMKFGTQPSARR